MLILYHGHSEFCLEGGDGFTLLTDPFDARVGYPMKSVRADAVTVSHAHSDHNHVEKALGAPAIVDRPGTWMLSPETRVTALPSVHDDAQGRKRGSNLIMKIEMEGLTLAHLGDQGAPLTPAQIAALGRVDVLFVPVGGFYTLDAPGARDAALALRARVVIPMHYRARVNADWPIADETGFVRLMGAEGLSPLPLLRVTRGDLSQQPPLVVLNWA